MRVTIEYDGATVTFGPTTIEECPLEPYTYLAYSMAEALEASRIGCKFLFIAKVMESLAEITNDVDGMLPKEFGTFIDAAFAYTKADRSLERFGHTPTT